MFKSILECVAFYADQSPAKLCVIDEVRELTYADYWQEVLKTKQFLQNKGIVAGDYVVVEVRQYSECLSLELGIQLCGAIFVPMEKNCGVKRIQAVMTMTAAALAVVNSNEKFAGEVLTYEEVAAELIKLDRVDKDIVFPEPDQTSEILFSTGTTGKPKGIELSHRNNIALAENVKYGVEMGPDNVEIIPVPLNHSHGLRRYYGNMLNGSTVILLNGVLDVRKVFYYMDQYKVTALDLVPASLAVLLKLSKDKFADYKNQLQYIQLGAAPLPEADKEKLCSLLPQTRLYNFYGSTESGCTCILDFNKEKGRTHCIGKPTCNVKLMFVDEDYKPMRPTEENPGLLAFYGSMNMKGYWRDVQETSQVIKDGYVYTNDLAYQDSEGYVYLKGRRGDVINVGGSKVAPEEIEEVVKRYAGIVDCACIGIPDKIKGYVPKLFVEVENKDGFDKLALSNYLLSELEPFKVPKQIEFINKIPRSFNGKILRKDLK